MTLLGFNKLNFDEKLFMVVDKGVFLDNYITEKIRMNLYAIENFFVELVYDSNENKVVEVRSFNYGVELDKYASHITIPFKKQ